MTERVERNGVTLAYDIAGRDDPPIVFVHGWSCDRSYFAPQFEHFAVRHAVAALDLRGHGDSSVPEPAHGTYEIDAFADDVLAVADAAGFDRPVVVGHGMGGVTALACAVRPGAVSAAVMVDPAPMACPTITVGQTVGAGHFNQLEVPDQVNLMIERFLAINLVPDGSRNGNNDTAKT